MARSTKGKGKTATKRKRPARTAQNNGAGTVEVPVKTAQRNRPEYGSDAVAELLRRNAA